MFNDMIEYYTPLATSLKTMAGYKTSTLLGASVFSAITMETIASILKINFLGVSVGVLATISLFIVIDWWTGSAASHKKAKQAKEDGDDKEYDKRKLKSSKVTFTIFKFISLYLWLVLTYTFMNSAINQGFIESHDMDGSFFSIAAILRIITIIPLILFGFREFISIGENIEKLSGKKPYLFELGEKIFNIFELGFLKKMQKSVDSASASKTEASSQAPESGHKIEDEDILDNK
jgi:hypothetical protein